MCAPTMSPGRRRLAGIAMFALLLPAAVASRDSSSFAHLVQDSEVVAIGRLTGVHEVGVDRVGIPPTTLRFRGTILVERGVWPAVAIEPLVVEWARGRGSTGGGAEDPSTHRGSRRLWLLESDPESSHPGAFRAGGAGRSIALEDRGRLRSLRDELEAVVRPDERVAAVRAALEKEIRRPRESP